MKDSVKRALDALRAALKDEAGCQVGERVEIYNEMTAMAAEFVDLPHPVLGVQLVPVDEVAGNDYNPNKVAPPEMDLLRLSIRKDGMTMPVVVARGKKEGKREVVDGFHRTTICAGSTDVRKSLGGYLPVVELDKSIEDRITSTVRHNMARGTHQVERSAKLVAALKKHNWTNERIGKELGMSADEVLRMKQVTGLAELFSDQEFSKAWDVDARA